MQEAESCKRRTRLRTGRERVSLAPDRGRYRQDIQEANTLNRDVVEHEDDGDNCRSASEVSVSLSAGSDRRRSGPVQWQQSAPPEEKEYRVQDKRRHTEGGGSKDALEDSLLPQRVDRLRLANVLALDANLGESCAMVRMISVCTEPRPFWDGSRRTSLLVRQPLARLGAVRHEEPRDQANRHRDKSLDDEDAPASEKLSASPSTDQQSERGREDVPPRAVGADAVNLEQPTREQAADSACTRSTDNVARQAEAKLVLAVCGRGRQGEPGRPSRVGGTSYAQKRDR